MNVQIEPHGVQKNAEKIIQILQQNKLGFWETTQSKSKAENCCHTKLPKKSRLGAFWKGIVANA